MRVGDASFSAKSSMHHRLENIVAQLCKVKQHTLRMTFSYRVTTNLVISQSRTSKITFLFPLKKFMTNLSSSSSSLSVGSMFICVELFCRLGLFSLQPSLLSLLLISPLCSGVLLHSRVNLEELLNV